MSDNFAFIAEKRERAGKGAARAIRRAGRVPAVIYGNKQDPVSVSLDPKELNKALHQHGFFSRVFELKLGKITEQGLARDVQFHPVTDVPMHVDFLRFAADAKMEVEVEVTFVNEEASPGLKRGGVLNIVRHEVAVLCSPTNIPATLEIDLTGAQIGDSIHISQVKLPEGVTPAITDRDFTVATIAAPTVMKETDDSAEEGEEDED